jgi:hypothetical protein
MRTKAKRAKKKQEEIQVTVISSQPGLEAEEHAGCTLQMLLAKKVQARRATEEK